MADANKKRRTTLKQRFVKWLLSEYVDSEIYQQMENAGVHDAVCKVDDLENKVDDFEYQLGDFESKCDEMENKVDDFEYNTIDNIRDEADRAIQDAKSEIVDLVNEKYEAELTFRSK
jgi:vacuolar-type H+-ATPase subunit I/STV1|tara:strand:- start:1027 stop:1377 length:351 start_codon:yes stop_codon:yes gene_type:complete